eukprot:5138612-Amphidinium_carterae.2
MHKRPAGSAALLVVSVADCTVGVDGVVWRWGQHIVWRQLTARLDLSLRRKAGVPCRNLGYHRVGKGAVGQIACWPCPESRPHPHTGALSGRPPAVLIVWRHAVWVAGFAAVCRHGSCNGASARWLLTWLVATPVGCVRV